MFKKNKIIIYIIMSGVIAGLLYFLKKTGKTDLAKKLAPFMQKWEGGLSSDVDDNASANPSPWNDSSGIPYHTNKGVTYGAFVGLASKAGYSPTKANFFDMPNHIWMSILQHGYMKPFPLHEIEHLPMIQACIITWAWGSGTGGAERHLASWQREEYGIVDNDITPTEIVQHFKRKVNSTNQKKWFLKLCDERLQDFQAMGDYWKYGKGWRNRLNDFVYLWTGEKNRYTENS
jgi:lysozyme family protein